MTPFNANNCINFDEITSLASCGILFSIFLSFYYKSGEAFPYCHLFPSLSPFPFAYHSMSKYIFGATEFNSNWDCFDFLLCVSKGFMLNLLQLLFAVHDVHGTGMVRAFHMNYLCWIVKRVHIRQLTKPVAPLLRRIIKTTSTSLTDQWQWNM